MMDGRALAIARIAGIEVRVHFSWIAIVAFVTVGVAVQPQAFPIDWPDWSRFAAGGILSVLFFVSIVVHELAHGIVARQRGLPVNSITIVFFGGLTAVEVESTKPRDELAIAGSGPLVSIVAGVAIAALAVGIGPEGSVLGLGAAVLAAVNILLGALNLVPALPFDGGRLLHAVVWAATGDRARATRLATRAGRLIGALGVGAGLLVSLAGDGWTGIAVLLSGWFILQGARVTERRQAIEDLLTGLHVEEVMERDLPTVGSTLTIDTFADQLLVDGERTSVPVVLDGALVGVIGVSQLRRLRRRRWPELRAADVMVSPPALPSLAADDAAWAGMELLRKSGLDAIPVMAGEALLGLLTRRSLVAAIQARATEQGRSGA
jgi:Zn-dependent protease